VDPNVSLQVAIASDKREFHVGETIPLHLAYSSAVKDRYQLNRAPMTAADAWIMSSSVVPRAELIVFYTPSVPAINELDHDLSRGAAPLY